MAPMFRFRVFKRMKDVAVLGLSRTHTASITLEKCYVLQPKFIKLCVSYVKPKVTTTVQSAHLSQNMIKESNRKPANRKLYCDMHLPLHTTLRDGSHVVIDAMTDAQVTEMYLMIAQAAINGQGFGVDEYPTEKDFRHEIRGGHSFIISNKECGKMIGAFALANSKFFRGNDVKVADPIIIVRRAERGKGIGDFIFKQVVQFSKRLGYSGIYTDTFCTNVPMIKIIERTPGFQRVGCLPLGGKMPDGALVGCNVYFKDMRNSGDDSITR